VGSKAAKKKKNQNQIPQKQWAAEKNPKSKQLELEAEQPNLKF
jgi:hypothetical protein